MTSFTTLNGLVLAGLLAAGASAFAQGTNPAPASPSATPAPGMMAPGHGMGKHDPAQRQAWMAKRQADLKAKLKITPAQEAAWTTFTTALQPMAHQQLQQAHAADYAELSKLPTPERLDKMKSLRAQHMAEMNTRMDQRAEATKTFYATLSPEQKKVFDAETSRMGQGRHGGHGLMHPHHG
jgi:protein CpxP